MNDSHPSGMPHVDGTPGLGQQVPKAEPLVPFTEWQRYLLDALDQIQHASPVNCPMIVNTLHTPDVKGMYAEEHATGLTRSVLALAVWSTGEVTPITWAEDGEGIVAIPPEMMCYWKLSNR